MAVALLPHGPALRRTVTPGRLALALGGAALVALALVGPARLIAQIEGDRGIAPIATTRDIMVGGIEVETTGKNAQEAREAGWKLAQRKGWEQLKGPSMGDGQLDSMVSAIVVEREQIGPHRYIATLGVIFDRSKAGQYVGTASGGGAVHSAPMLVIPVLRSGGTAQVFEVRGPWQKAWAEFKTAASPVDYIRPSGGGADSLYLTAGQPGRRSRLWWRTVLDQFSATDVLIPEARLERQWPGGPVRGTFTARYGPDNKAIESFTLTANNEAGVPEMFNAALVRIDGIYANALRKGLLKPDATLTSEQSALDAALNALASALRPKDQPKTEASDASETDDKGEASQSASDTIGNYNVQFASPDAASVDAALSAVRGAPGVQSASTTSIAIGGTSVMRITLKGDLPALAAALRSRGWGATVSGSTLSIRK